MKMLRLHQILSLSRNSSLVVIKACQRSGMAKAESKRLKQTGFTGGIQLSLLAWFGFQIRIAATVNRVDGQTKSGMGPITGLIFCVPVGVFKIGTYATIIRTQPLQSTALHTGILI
jgi:hypothetical protein